MNAKDLMIGDWVLHKGEIKIVISIPTEHKVALQYEGQKYGSIYDTTPVGEIAPVLLTPEILEANGFKEYIPGLNLMYGLGGPYIASNEEGNQWVFGLVKKDESARFPLVKITFVHQLQHALKLCGIDKEIVL